MSYVSPISLGGINEPHLLGDNKTWSCSGTQPGFVTIIATYTLSFHDKE